MTNRLIFEKNYIFISNENAKFSFIFKIILIELFKYIKIDNARVKLK